MTLKTLVVGFGMALAGAGVAHAGGASAGACERALQNMYRLAGLQPNAEAHKNNLARCQKDQSPAAAACMAEAKDLAGLQQCQAR